MSESIILGNIITMDREHPRAEAAVIKKGRFTYVGTRDEALAISKGKVTDLGERTILPGFIDTHVHVIPSGIFLNSVDLSRVGNIEEALDALKRAALENKSHGWLIGAFFQDKDIEEKRFPTRSELDSIAPNRPILICHNDLHPIALNSRALSMVKIDPKLDGIMTDEAGELTGVIEDPACLTLLGDIIGKLGLINIIKGIKKVDNYAVEHGVTTVFGKDALIILKLRELCKGLFNTEFVPMWFSDGCRDMDGLKKFLKNKSFSSRCCVCAFADGSFDAHSAAVFEPYKDKPDTCGIPNYTDDEMYEFTMEAHKAGVQVSFHAIGDAAIDQVLRVYERVLTDWPRPDHRLRIEHFEEPHPESIAHAARLGVALGMQPLLIEVCEHMDFSGYEPFIGDRVRLCSPYRSILDAGILVGGGTDFTVTPMDVMHGAQIAMTHPVETERITLHEYLEMNTVNAARLGFLEDRKGCIRQGMDADMVVLSRDPYETETDRLSDIKVVGTYCKGRKVFERSMSNSRQ